mgnify:CR=1 FL=1
MNNNSEYDDEGEGNGNDEEHEMNEIEEVNLIISKKGFL